MFETEGSPTLDAEHLHGRRAMYYYDHTDLPFYYELADTFSLADRNFCSLLGPTYTNRNFLYAGTCFGLTDCQFPDLDALGVDDKRVTITDLMAEAGRSFGIFIDGDETVASVAPRIGTVYGDSLTKLLQRGLIRGSGNAYSFKDFLDLANKGELPDLTFVDADIREDADGNDEHAPGWYSFFNSSPFILHLLFVACCRQCAVWPVICS
jgi:phospholipase C